MCRFYGFRATEPTKVECTLVHAQNALLIQSRVDRRGESHPDGWGVGFYHDDLPEVERSASPAFEDLHFNATAERVYARTVLAHVRQATVGGGSIANTHPFHHGPWLFAHNGTVSPYDRVRPLLEKEADPKLLGLRRGTTDSETVFYWLLTRMQRAGIDPKRPVEDLPRLVSLVGDSVRQVARWCDPSPPELPARLNFLLTDGRSMIAVRWNHTLHWIVRRGIHDCEICGISHVAHHRGAEYRAVIVASEPISTEDWQEVPDRTILSIDAGVHLDLQPL